ncbi:hypothetical protein LOTGIDRAFT_237103 [Lottia gigantea]|uniref:Laminin G domain-containing protein n=1 Tax=Lottia gigantea TaxID=225164 RepID=V3ZMY5_LOTGI|nr:hypothetical protein LOTGIDRAFT_237103 [Lottia gigantea]ESO82196.1 hypothetical protein LOTGIDRAFT_237103 [Lottia gigantea]
MFLIFTISLFLVFGLSEAKKGPCFNFNGNDYLKYRLENVDIAHNVWYKLTFKTEQENGLLLYAEGSHDYEAIFLRGGKLHYFLFNPSSHGVGGTFGGQFKSDAKVNNETWITVEVFRNREPKLMQNDPLIGMVLTSEDGEKEKHIEYGARHDVQIVLPIYIAGTNKDLGAGGQKFVGQIKDMREKLSGAVFNEPTWNSGALRCLDIRPAQ